MRKTVKKVTNKMLDERDYLYRYYDVVELDELLSENEINEILYETFREQRIFVKEELKKFLNITKEDFMHIYLHIYTFEEYIALIDPYASQETYKKYLKKLNDLELGF